MYMLFGPPLVCAVWLNYEVVVFQPWSGNSLNLGSIANVTSKLNPALMLSTVLWIFHFHSPSVSLFPPHPPHVDWSTPIFCTLFSPFLSGLGSPVYLDNRTLPPASTSRLCARWLDALDLLSSIPLGPWIPAPHARLCRLSPCLFGPLSPPSIPCGFFILGSALPLPLNQTTTLPCRTRPASGSLPVLRIFSSQVSGLLSSCPPVLRAPSSPALVLPRTLISSGGF